MNHDDDKLKDLEAFVAVLTDNAPILLGGADYQSWATKLLELCLQHREVVACGGLLVPQLGEAAGLPKAFETAASKFHIDHTALSSALQPFWDARTIEKRVVSVLSSEAGDPLVCVFSPISYGFDRPIGYFWALTQRDDGHETERILHYAATLASLCVRAQKACYALQLLSEPVRRSAATAEAAATRAVHLSREALSCKAAILWRLNREENLLKKQISEGDNFEGVRVDMELGKGLAGICARDNTTRVVDDLWAESNVQHHDLVRDRGLRAGIFVSLDTGKESLGVLAAYASRPNAFSQLDVNIVSSIAQWLVTRLIQETFIEETRLIRKKIDREMPLIEAGILAMGRVHDVKNKLFFAQNDLNGIAHRFRTGERNSPIYQDAISASKHIDDAKDIISALVRRARLTRQNLKRQSLVALLKTLIAEVDNECGPNNITIELKVVDDVTVQFDKSLMKRAFENLFDNAFHFLSAKSGKREIVITITASPEYVRVDFRDTGKGISPHNIGQIFDIFYTTKGDRGMGFGLAIVKRIIEEHGGNIAVSSVWGEFTTFHLRLPRN